MDHLVKEGKRKIVLDYTNQDSMLSKISELAMQGRMCVVCVYGDTNVSDKQLIEKLGSKGVNLELLPGISSVQLACARLKISLEDSLLVTFHKRGSIESEKFELRDQAKKGRRYVLVLPRPWDFMPGEIAKFLIFAGIEEQRKVTILQSLALDGETIRSYSLKELSLSQEAFSDLTILVVSPHEEKVLT